MKKIVLKKCLPYVEYGVYIVWLQFAVLIFRPMTWSVLILHFGDERVFNIPETVSNILIYLMTIFVAACFFKSPKMLYREFLSLLAKKALLPVFAIRFSADIIESVLNSNSSLPAAVAVLLMEAAVFFVTIFLIERAVGESEKQHHISIALVIVLLLLFLTIVLFVLYALHAENTVRHITEKYQDSSFLSCEQAFGISFQLINLLFSTLLWTGAFLYFGLFRRYAEKKKEGYRIHILLSRAACILMVTLAFAAVKLYTIPQGTLIRYTIESSRTTTYIDEKNIDADYHILEIFRVDSVHPREKATVHKKTTVHLRRFNRTILKFQRTANRDRGAFRKEAVPADGIFYRYDFDAVAYMNPDGGEMAMLTKEINHYQQKDENLIALMEYLIGEGYFEAFEFSYQYLQRYDAEFIAPYLEADAADYFCGNEKNDYLNPEYMTDFLHLCGSEQQE